MRPQTQMIEDLLQPLGLTASQAAVYIALLRLRLACAAEVAEAVDRPEGRVEPDLRTLVRLGIVEDCNGRYLARHPAAALGRLIAPRLDRIAAESRRIDELLASVRMLARHHDAGQDYHGARLAVDLISGADALRATMSEVAMARPPADLISVIPDHRTVHDLAHKYADEWVRAQREGVISSRVILPVCTVTLPGAHDLLTRLTDARARIRTLDRLPSWYVAIGDDAAWLPVQWGGNLPDSAYHFCLVRSPLMVSVLRALFEELWARAVPLSRPERKDGVVRVLRLAAQGMSDEMIARHLGVCVRTVRSRFAEAMAELGARSRFHAGVEATRRGWLSVCGGSHRPM
ncbi:helix-turn-helix domain-containing protein [Thermopolyspora sp. NPDC052614]|uniref:helix-turn-helix transcriptional regulator n=1 Tax=Thermopolyspora sp. NPDC052614 TaxID=3155682 RepID=UPI00341F78EC